MVKKIISILSVFAVVASLSGCLPASTIMRNLQLGGSTSRSKRRAEQIVEAIQEQDKEAIKAMFSESALDGIEDIDGEIENLFSFCDGEIISFERGSMHSSEQVEYGEKMKMSFDFPLYIETENESITMYVIDNSIDVRNPEDEGLYSLQVYKDKWDYTWAINPDDTPGIHMPEKVKIEDFYDRTFDYELYMEEFSRS